MSFMPDHIRPDDWLCRLFSARAAVQGGVVRRNTRDILRIVGWKRFLSELDRRGFRAAENAGQTINFCNRNAVHIVR